MSIKTKLLESETGFQALFQYATVGILVIKSDGIIQLVNPYIEKYFGYKNEELIGKPVEILIPKSMHENHANYRQSYFANPKVRPMGHGLNLFGVRKDGVEFPVEISLGHYELYGERLAVAFVTDITERMKVEEQARRTEREYRLIFDGIQESFILQKIIKDENGNIVDLLFLEVNPATEKILGKQRDEIIGHLRSEFFGPPNNDLIQIINRVEKGENVRYQQYMDFIGRWFDRSFYSFTRGQLIILSTDITQHKLDEEALRKSQAALEDETIALSFLNEAGNRLSHINSLNEALDEMVRASIHLMGADMCHVQLLDAERKILTIAAQRGFRKEFLDYFKEVRADDSTACGRALIGKTQIVVEDTEVDALFEPHREIARQSNFRALQCTPLYDHDGFAIGMISTHYKNPFKFIPQELSKMQLYARKAESFIERYRMYEALEAANTLLETKVTERTYQLKAALEKEKEYSQLKSRFMSIASHEFRTPLTTILSSVSLIENYNKEEEVEKRRKHTVRIKSSVKNLTDILDDFLSIDKLEQGRVQVKKEKFDLYESSAEIIDELNGLLKVGQVIQFLFSGDRKITQDKKILKHIMFNLLSNAIKYSEENKSIYLSIRAEADQVLIEVKDDGIGIPQEDQKNLFSQYYRAKNVTNIQGTGLGLNIVKRYTELLGGNITFTSKQGEGTTFILSFPA